MSSRGQLTELPNPIATRQQTRKSRRIHAKRHLRIRGMSVTRLSCNRESLYFRYIGETYEVWATFRKVPVFFVVIVEQLINCDRMSHKFPVNHLIHFICVMVFLLNRKYIKTEIMKNMISSNYMGGMGHRKESYILFSKNKSSIFPSNVGYLFIINTINRFISIFFPVQVLLGK